MYGEARPIKHNAYKRAKVLKQSRDSIQDENRPYWPTLASTLRMAVSVTAFIFIDRNVSIDDIPKQLAIFVHTAYKIAHD